jgi:hypothetical protein
MSLWSDFLRSDARLVSKWKHYFPAYERHFGRFVNGDVLMIEIGCGEGGSLPMWKAYFGPHARIVGLDIRPECAAFKEDQIEVRIGDQSDPKFLSAVCAEFGVPDILLDDGSHQMPHIHASFNYLYPKMRPNSVYMVEDLHTAYWANFGGGLGSPASFIETSKNLIDELNADHVRNNELLPNDFTRSTLSMHFYDSIIVFEKGRHTEKLSLSVGGSKT